MQFIALIYQNENIQKNFSKEEWGKIYVEYQAVGKELTEKGQLLAGYGLQPTLAGKTVQSQEGRVSVQDGPAYRTEDMPVGGQCDRGSGHGNSPPDRGEISIGSLGKY